MEATAKSAEEILNGPDFFQCDKLHSRMKRSLCVDYQRDGYRPSCRKCDQGEEIAGDYLKDHTVSMKTRQYIPHFGYRNIKKKTEVKRMEQKIKICSKCGNEKPLEEFPTHRQCKDGHAGQCKVCKAEYNREYHAKQKKSADSKSGKAAQAKKEKETIVAVKIVTNFDPLLEVLRSVKKTMMDQVEMLDRSIGFIQMKNGRGDANKI